MNISPNVQFALAAVFALLAVATVAAVGMAQAQPARDFSELKLRFKTWWLIVLVFCLAIASNRTVALLVLGFVSFLALKEFLSLAPTRRADRHVLLWAYLAIPIQLLWVGMGWYGLFIIFIPVHMFLLLPLVMVLIGEIEGFLRVAGTLHWGLMTTVFSLSHTAYLLALPDAPNPAGGGPALLFFLLFLTEFNDIAQAVAGRCFGRHKVTPKVSPKKTVEGLIAGVVLTSALAWALAPYLTPLTGVEALAVGALIGLAGFIGDVTVSAVKRDIGIRESGTLLPGHGGILDRLDSLTYTAPVFFHALYYLHY
jgi:phosphatidate cytidylyltransferase